MATQIKATPVLRGKDARDFERRVNERKDVPVPRSDYERAQKVYQEVKSKSDVWF